MRGVLSDCWEGAMAAMRKRKLLLAGGAWSAGGAVWGPGDRGGGGGGERPGGGVGVDAGGGGGSSWEGGWRLLIFRRAPGSIRWKEFRATAEGTASHRRLWWRS